VLWVYTLPEIALYARAVVADRLDDARRLATVVRVAVNGDGKQFQALLQSLELPKPRVGKRDPDAEIASFLGALSRLGVTGG